MTNLRDRKRFNKLEARLITPYEHDRGTKRLAKNIPHHEETKFK
jgi:hypothetical protein